MKPDETEDYVDSWLPLGSVTGSGRSGLYQPEVGEGPSYPYGALAINNLIFKWMKAAEKDPEEIITDDEEGPSYAYGALSPKFKVDSIILESSNFEYPAPAPNMYTVNVQY